MSADNMIYVQLRNERYWVWMGYASDDKAPAPHATDHSFPTYPEALAYAQGWLRGESIVEYGIQPLEDLKGMEQKLHVTFNQQATAAQVESLSDAIVTWLDGEGLTALIVAGDETDEVQDE